MKDYIQRKVAEFKEIQKESFMTATAKPLLLQPEAVVWYEEILIETITQTLAEERERVREYLNHYKTKSYCCSQTVDDIYTKYTKVMNDSKPFKHGEEGTHNVCNKHNIGGKSVCCECSGKDDCGDEPMKPSEIFEGENSSLKKTFDEAVAREQSHIDQGSILDLSGGGSGYGTCGNCGGVVDDGHAPQGKRKCRYGAWNCRD